MGASTVAVNDETFETEIEKHNGVSIVDFWNTGCPPCRMLSPILDELAAELSGKVKIAKVDIDEATDITVQNRVTSIPCLIMFKDGQEVDRAYGYQPKAQLKSWIESHVK